MNIITIAKIIIGIYADILTNLFSKPSFNMSKPANVPAAKDKNQTFLVITLIDRKASVNSNSVIMMALSGARFPPMSPVTGNSAFLLHKYEMSANAELTCVA